MQEKWTGDLVGKMHNHKITYTDLANELGVHKTYVSMILRGERKPQNARKRLESAVNAIIQRRKEENRE